MDKKATVAAEVKRLEELRHRCQMDLSAIIEGVETTMLAIGLEAEGQPVLLAFEKSLNNALEQADRAIQIGEEYLNG